MVNSNPETVSTDYDVSSRLYFEPLTAEDVLNIVDKEHPMGVIVQLGGQTPLKLAGALHAAGVPLLGTSFDSLDLAENRSRWRDLVASLGLRQPESRIASTHPEAQRMAAELGYPVLVRPSYVLGGRGMRIVHEPTPRASRTVPFVSKAVGIPLARLAARVMTGERLADLLPAETEPRMISVKKPVLPFSRFPGEDALLGPEMKSTGEVMGRDLDFGRALAKAHLGAGEALPTSGNVLLSVRDDDKRAITFMAKKLVELGYGLVATRGTARFLSRNGIPVREVFKVHEGRPHVADLIENGEIQLVINTPLGRASEYDEQAIRERAVAMGVTVVTTLAGAQVMVAGLEAVRRGPLDVTSLQECL